MTGNMAAGRHCAGVITKSSYLKTQPWAEKTHWEWNGPLKPQNPPQCHTSSNKATLSMLPQQFHQLETKHSNMDVHGTILIQSTTITNCWEKWKSTESCKQNDTSLTHREPISITSDFSVETLKIKRTWINVLQVLKDWRHQLRQCNPQNTICHSWRIKKNLSWYKDANSSCPLSQPYWQH